MACGCALCHKVRAVSGLTLQFGADAAIASHPRHCYFRYWIVSDQKVTDGTADHENNLIEVLLDTIEHRIIPKTKSGVAAGNKIFGAALLRKSDLSLVLAETNNETENPLWHGEVHTLKRFFEMAE